MVYLKQTRNRVHKSELGRRKKIRQHYSTVLFLCKITSYYRSGVVFNQRKCRETMKERQIEHLQKSLSFCTAQTFFPKENLQKLISNTILFQNKMAAFFDRIVVPMVKE